MQKVERFSAFDGMNVFSEGTLFEVTQEVRKRWASSSDCRILVFSQSTGRQMDIDPTVADQTVNQSLPHSTALVRPKLGVVGREVTLLPRHLEWLNSHSGGASVALRKLVEMAMRENSEKYNARLRHEAAYKFMTAIAGDLPGYEEALRSLFAIGASTHPTLQHLRLRVIIQ